MATKTDDRGRLYLPKELRERHGERFRVIDLPSRTVLVSWTTSMSSGFRWNLTSEVTTSPTLGDCRYQL